MPARGGAGIRARMTVGPSGRGAIHRPQILPAKSIMSETLFAGFPFSTVPDKRQAPPAHGFSPGIRAPVDAHKGTDDAHIESGPSHTASGPSHTASGPSHMASGPSHTVSGSTHTASMPLHTVSGPSHTASMPLHTVSGPSHIKAGPMRACASAPVNMNRAQPVPPAPRSSGKVLPGR